MHSRAMDGGSGPIDPLELAALDLWVEIRALLPRYRRLFERRSILTASQLQEMLELRGEIERLKARSHRYREVMRNEALAARRARPTEQLELMAWARRAA